MTTSPQIRGRVASLDPAAGAAETDAGAEERAGILRSARVVGLITLLSRITGLFRDNVQARFLGTGNAGDAFRVALLIPSLLRRLVGEGAIQSGFVPVFAQEARDPSRLRDLAEKVLTLWSVLLLAATALGMGLSVWLLLGLGPLVSSWDPEKLRLTAALTLGLFGYLFFIGLSSVAQGVLNSVKVFALPAANPLFFNLAFIASGFVYYFFLPAGELPAAWAFVGGVLAGGVLQFVVLVPSLWRRGIRLRPRSPLGDESVRKLLRLLVPSTIGAGVYQVNTMVSMLLAMAVPVVGAVSSLYFSGRILEIVLGIYVFAFSTVSLTTLSRQAGDGDLAGFRATLTEVMRLVSFITIPSTVGLILLAGPLVDLILVGGRFDAESRRLTISALYGHLPGLYFVGISRVLVSAFYAFKDVWTPVRLGAASMVLNAGLSYALSKTPLEHAGLAWASTLAAVFQWLLLFLAFQRRHRLVAMGDLGASTLRSGLAVAAMGAACALVLPLRPSAGGRWALLAFVAGVIVLAIAVYFLAARLLKAPELEAFLGRSRRQVRPSTKETKP
jgi:putative peptidoglycan lipid II flippase